MDLRGAQEPVLVDARQHLCGDRREGRGGGRQASHRSSSSNPIEAWIVRPREASCPPLDGLRSASTAWRMFSSWCSWATSVCATGSRRVVLAIAASTSSSCSGWWCSGVQLAGGDAVHEERLGRPLAVGDRSEVGVAGEPGDDLRVELSCPLAVDHAGTFHAEYQFQGSVGTFPFRAEIPAGQTNFPYTRGYSNTINITTRSVR